jgi:hypothetical protein
MISTIESKQQQLINGFFERGTGAEKILILGSCRTLPYLSYLIRWNESNGDRFTIRRIDPCDWTVENVDIETCERDERIQRVISSTNIFIHEHLESYSMFNTSKETPKNIYQLGMNPLIDIAIPNFHDRFALENDWVDCGMQTPDNYIEHGEAAMEGFCEICKLSSFPEMGDYFRESWRSIRFFWRPNHISAAFSMYIFRRINSRFLHLKLTDEFIEAAKQEDLFKTPCTQPTQRDREAYRLQW